MARPAGARPDNSYPRLFRGIQMPRFFRACRWHALIPLALLFVLVPIATADSPAFEFVDGTAVLLSKAANTGGGGNGGTTSSASSATNIFAPASYVDYHENGGEPTTVVDRYPFAPGQLGNNTPSNQYRDLVYVSNPLGVGFP